MIGFLVGWCFGLWTCYWLMTLIVVRDLERQRDTAWADNDRYLAAILAAPLHRRRDPVHESDSDETKSVGQ